MFPHIFADPDPDQGSQNLVDPTDPDLKHWFKYVRLKILALKRIVMKELLDLKIECDRKNLESNQKQKKKPIINL